ncbi:MAG: T9SS type A sorting domain-containing protein [Bacteroidetes bacterium]|jgi:hypothetical protein|nr:T9SS type A sorting domain-containing protein [Bacteroidota bacterium]
MKKRIVFFVLAALVVCIPAGYCQQQMELQVVANSGLVLTSNSGNTLHFTLGEVMVTESQSDNNLLSQGFHQVVVLQSVSDEEPLFSGIKLQVYPNPGSDFLNVETDTPVKVSVVDLHGRSVLPAIMVPVFTSLDVQGLAAGVYFLHATDAAGKIFKIFPVLLTH